MRAATREPEGPDPELGLELYHEVEGEGAPVLLVPGMGLAISEMRPLRQGLARGFLVVAADNRGSGRSPTPPGPYSVEQMAADQARVLLRLGLAPAHVVGVSMGGRIALSLALEHPGLVRRLVLISTGPRASGRGLLIRAGMAVSRLPLLRGRERQPWAAHKAQFAASRSFDCSARLGEIRSPTLIVHGRSDHIASPVLAREMHQRIAGSQLLLLPGGHLIALGPWRVAPVLAAVTEFLREGSDAQPGPISG